MQDVLYVENLEQAATLLKPRRLEILRHLGEPHSCLELARMLEDAPQKIYYHVKALEQVGLVDRVSERRVRGILEGFYQARARSYWLAPSLVGHIGPRRHTQEQASLGFLLGLAEQLQTEVGHLAESQAPELPSLGLAAQFDLQGPEQRANLLHDLQECIQVLARKYGRRDDDPPSSPGQTFQLLVACYPTPEFAAPPPTVDPPDPPHA